MLTKRTGNDVVKLQKRQEVMDRKKLSHPNRWAKGRIRYRSSITKVTLNEMPEKEKNKRCSLLLKNYKQLTTILASSASERVL